MLKGSNVVELNGIRAIYTHTLFTTKAKLSEQLAQIKETGAKLRCWIKLTKGIRNQDCCVQSKVKRGRIGVRFFW